MLLWGFIKSYKSLDWCIFHKYAKGIDNYVTWIEENPNMIE